MNILKNLFNFFYILKFRDHCKKIFRNKLKNTNGMLFTYGEDPGSLVTPLAMCEGDCDYDSDCKGDLICFQRDGDESVPGCDDSQYATTGYAYCVSPTFH